MTGSQPPAEIDKNQHYGEWLRASRWQDALYRRAAHKSLDIPEEMGDITTNVRRGLGWQELAVIALLALGSGGLGAWSASRLAAPAAPREPLSRPAERPEPIEGRIRFWIEEDTLRLEHDQEKGADVRVPSGDPARD